MWAGNSLQPWLPGLDATASAKVESRRMCGAAWKGAEVTPTYIPWAFPGAGPVKHFRCACEKGGGTHPSLASLWGDGARACVASPSERTFYLKMQLKRLRSRPEAATLLSEVLRLMVFVVVQHSENLICSLVAKQTCMSIELSGCTEGRMNC